MRLRSFVVGLAAVVWASALAMAQVDSNIAFQPYAQGRGVSKIRHCSTTTATLCNTDADCPFGETCPLNPGTACATVGGEGCGGCYPEALALILAGDLLGQLTLVNPEWQPIGPMISAGPGYDPLPPPQSAPVQIRGTVALTKINIGGDFPGSHVGDDQNTFIQVDPADLGLLASGNSGPPSCPNGEGCGLVEMEREFKKYPLFAWAGEGDGISAVGRWIFDCGHPDMDPLGTCSNNPSKSCIVDSDCSSPGTCTAPAPTSNLRAELHPPHALAIFRNKSHGKTPATQASVYVSADTGGAGDACTVTHLTGATDVLFTKSCFLNHCSVDTNHACTVDKDCAAPQKCVVFDPTQGGPLMDINASDFDFDMPLPPAPPSGTATLKIVTKNFKPAGGLSPKAIFTPANGSVGTATTLHVKVPMSVALKPATYPNVFAQRITAYWKEDTTKLTHVQVAFQSLTIHNPLKAAAPVFNRVCTKVPSDLVGGLSATSCTTNTDCPAGTCLTNFKTCYSDSDCPKKDSCSDPTVCVGGVTPGWELFGEVNGDWIQFAGLTKVGTEGDFPAAPYIKPLGDPTPILLTKPRLKFDEYVPSTGGTLHIASTGHGLGCNDAYLYGHNLKESLHRYGLGVGAGCFGEGDPNPGRLEVIHTGPNFTAAPANILCTGSGTPAACCTGAGSGTCDANILCTGSGAPSACCDGSGTGSCSDNTLCTGAGTPFPCCTGSGTGACSTVTCTPGVKATDPTACVATSGRGDGGSCSGDATRLCLVDADCVSPQTCNGACSDTGDSCHVNADCDPGATCESGHAFDLNYTIKVL